MVADRTIVVVAGVGAAAVAGVAYWRWRSAQAERAADAAKDPCEVLRLAGASEAQIAACKAGKVILGEVIEAASEAVDSIISGQVKDFRKTNEAKNGRVVDENPLKISPEFFKQAQNWPWYVQMIQPDYTTKTSSVSMMRGMPPLHENGCIPAPGARLSETKGWHRCAEGSASYVMLDEAVPIPLGNNRYNGSSFRRTYTGAYLRPDPEERDPLKFRAQVLDPLTHRHWQATGTGSLKDHKFPLQVADGQEPWWVLGNPYVAPAMGKVPLVEWMTDGSGDARAKSVSFIDEVVVERPPPPVALPPGTGQPPEAVPETPPLDNPGPGYVWQPDPSLPPPSGYWRRKRASEA